LLIGAFENFSDSTDGASPLHCAAKRGCLDQILGTQLPESAKVITGDLWWNRNQELLKEKIAINCTYGGWECG